MKLEDQVCSLELAKRLKELGVSQLSLCYWWQYDKDSWDLTISVYPTWKHLREFCYREC